MCIKKPLYLVNLNLHLHIILKMNFLTGLEIPFRGTYLSKNTNLSCSPKFHYLYGDSDSQLRSPPSDTASHSFHPYSRLRQRGQRSLHRFECPFKSSHKKRAGATASKPGVSLKGGT